jgi:surface antigen
MSSESTDAFGVPAAESASDAPVFLSRREARAARDAAAAKPIAAPAAFAAEVAAEPLIPIAPSITIATQAAVSTGVVVPRSRTLPKAKRARKNPLRAMASMAVIGGLFAVTALPAYGQTGLTSDEGSTISFANAADAATVRVQSLTVSADLTLPELERDQFDATSPEDLELIRQQSAIASANSVYAASGARALGDDYPWATAGYDMSALNYYYRQCTDFVAWRLNRDVGSFSAPFRWAWADLTPNGGNASQWKDAWDAHGWTVSATPIAGSVAWFGWDNHVAYVKTVNADGSVLVEEYNYVNRVYSQRTLAAADVEAFLYPPGQ